MFPECKFNISIDFSKCKRKFRFFIIFFRAFFIQDLARFLPNKKPLLLHNQEGYSQCPEGRRSRPPGRTFRTLRGRRCGRFRG